MYDFVGRFFRIRQAHPFAAPGVLHAHRDEHIPIAVSIHFHMLFLDGVYIDSKHGTNPRFSRVKAPTGDELTQLTHTIAPPALAVTLNAGVCWNVIPATVISRLRQWVLQMKIRRITYWEVQLLTG